MINIHEETGVQCINKLSQDQTHIEKRTDFIRTENIDTRRFFMTTVGIAHMLSLVNEFRNQTLLLIMIDHTQKFDF